jgi:hypothetical protein
LVQAVPGAVLYGRTRFSGTRPSDLDLLRSALVLRPTDERELPTLATARIEVDGTFVFDGLPEGLYGLGVLPTSAIRRQIGSITVGGKEVLGEPLVIRPNGPPAEVQLDIALPEVTGVVYDSSKQPAGHVKVVAFPPDRRFWRSPLLPFPVGRRLAGTVTDNAGIYRLELAAGDYLVVATAGELPADWGSEEYLSRLVPFAQRASLGHGSVPARVNLVLAAGKRNEH